MLEEQDMESVRDAVRFALESTFNNQAVPFTAVRVREAIIDLPEIDQALATNEGLLDGVILALNEAKTADTIFVAVSLP